MGYYYGAEVLGINLEGGMYGNIVCIQYSDGQFRYGQDLTSAALIASLGQAEFGFLEYSFKDNSGLFENTSWKGLHTEKDSWTIAGASAYFIAGGSFSVGFDLNSFLPWIDKLIDDLR